MRSLRRQLIVGLLLAFVVLLGAGGGLVYWAVRRSLYDQFDSALRLKALVVVTDTQISANRVRVRFSDRFLREFDRTVATDFFQVFDQQGDTVAKSDSIGTWRLPGKLKGTLDAPVFWNLSLPNGTPGRAIGIAFTPRVRADEQSQELTVVVAASRQSVVETLQNLRVILAGCGVTLLALTALVVPWILKRQLRPLGDVAERASRIDADSLSQRFPLESMPLELRPIAEKLNDLLARLEASFERERRFSSDLAHELRTPLAELRSQAELALKWPEERTPDADRSVLEISMQLEQLVARLLTLSRAENPSQPLHRSAARLDALVTENLRRLEARIQEARLDVQQHLDGGTVTTDPVLADSVISNLLENAVTYSPMGARVVVRFSRSAGGDEFALSVTNPAPGLTEADLPKLFDRFWRKDGSRTDGSHSGLGLSLARSFAQLLGCRLEASLDAERCLTMTFSGPV